MKTDDELSALAALAEAATPGPYEVRNRLACVELVRNDGAVMRQVAAAYPRDIHRASEDVAQAERDMDYFAAASPDVVRELVARVLKAEAIVRDMAKADPSGIVDYEGNWSEITPGEGAIEGCRFCGERQHGPVEDWKHADGCLWRRAVEAQL